MIQTRTLAPAARLADDGHDGLDETTFAPPPKDHQHDINRPSLLDYNVECFREILHWRDNDASGLVVMELQHRPHAVSAERWGHSPPLASVSTSSSWYALPSLLRGAAVAQKTRAEA